jgi:hypothetical protein
MISRIKTTWQSSGLAGFPGYTFTYFNAPNLQPSQVAIFWDSIKAYFPTQMSWLVDPTIVELDETNGKMTGTRVGDAPAAVQATGSANYVPQAGCQVKWYTTGFVNGKAVRGRWFLVPMITSTWTSYGLINTTTTGAIKAAANALRSASGATLCVWSRPLWELDAQGKPTDVLKRPGSAYQITSVDVPLKSVTLNSRRDAG